MAVCVCVCQSVRGCRGEVPTNCMSAWDFVFVCSSVYVIMCVGRCSGCMSVSVGSVGYSVRFSLSVCVQGCMFTCVSLSGCGRMCVLCVLLHICVSMLLYVCQGLCITGCA